MTPTVKQLLSSLAFAVLACVLKFAQVEAIPLMPVIYQGIFGAILTAVAHFIPARGTTEKVLTTGKP